MSTPIIGDSTNGHLSPNHEMTSIRVAERPRLASDPPHLPNGIVDRPSPSSSDHHREASLPLQDIESVSPSEPSEKDNVSEDADFDTERSPETQHEEEEVVEENQESSDDSNNATKRKGAPGETDYMNANPELYGLRRSVCFDDLNSPRPHPLSPLLSLLTLSHQDSLPRAKNNRKLALSHVVR